MSSQQIADFNADLSTRQARALDLGLDSKVVPYPELSQLNQRGIWFVTIRRRGAAILRRLRTLPASPWRQAVIDTAPRRQPHVRDREETGPCPGAQGALRQRAVTGPGRVPPTGCRSHNTQASARALRVRDASRQRVEDGLGSSGHGFPRDGVARAGRRQVDLATTMTVLAKGCARWRAQPLRGFDTAAPQQRSRTCVATAGGVDSQPARLVVHCDKRCHNPIVRDAALDQPSHVMPWWRNLPVVFQYP